MSNIKSIGKVTPVNQEAVEILERHLEKARQGDVQEVFLVMTHLNGDSGVDFTSTSNVFDRIGRLQHAINRYSAGLEPK